LTGPIPEELYDIAGLRLLRLSDNTALNGTLSEGISNLKSLQRLRIGNTAVGGTLPSGLFDLIDLKELELNDCSFSGTLPESFVKLGNATEKIRLNNNTFNGTIPMAFEQMTYLRKFSNGKAPLSSRIVSNRLLFFSHRRTRIAWQRPHRKCFGCFVR
jgi:hypothetical protein